MHPTDLTQHPEGGSYKRVYCSEQILTDQKKGERPAISHIYFKLGQDDISTMHRVTSDEVWNLYQGEGLYLYLWDGSDSVIERIEISAANNKFCHVVPAGYWQAAKPIAAEILVGCSVAPAFDFADFTLLGETTDEKSLFLTSNPKYSELIRSRKQ